MKHILVCIALLFFPLAVLCAADKPPIGVPVSFAMLGPSW